MRYHQRRLTGAVAHAAALFLVTGFLSAAAPQEAWAAGCTAGTASDFNGDGIRDVAIADPEATVNGTARAGIVHVVYGGGKGEAEIDEDLSWIPGTAEAGDRYGFSLATYDANLDGCTDLVVGTPYESVDDVPNAGMVQVVHGSPTGLTDSPAVVGYVQSQALFKASAEPDDWFGYAVAAGNSPSGQPFLAIGVPGEDLEAPDAGLVDYVYGTAQSLAILNQTAPGVNGTEEENDRFGSAIAADPAHLAVSVPGEAIGANAFAGGVHVFSTTINSDGIPTPLAGVTGGTADPDGVEVRPGAEFGNSVALVPALDSSLLVVGVPGAELAGGAGAGEVLIFGVSATGTVTYDHTISQDVAGVQGTSEPNDRFGQKVAAVNLTPGTAAPEATMLVAVGVPGEDTDKGVDTGGVQVFSLTGAPGDSDVRLAPGDRGVPGTEGARDYTGMSLSDGGQQLYLGVPYGDSADRAVLGVPWSDLDGTVSPLPETISQIAVWKPGQDGVPAGGVAFGAVVR